MAEVRVKKAPVPTPTPVATPPAPRGPRYRYLSNPPETVTLKLGDIAPQIPPGSRASLFDADRVVEVPAADLFAGPVPRLSLARLAEIAPDCVLKPEQDTKIKVPAARLARSYQMAEKSELIEEPEPVFNPAPEAAAVEPIPAEGPFAPVPPSFEPPQETAPVVSTFAPAPPPASPPAPVPAPLPMTQPPVSAMPAPASRPAPPPEPTEVEDFDRPPTPVRLTPQAVSAPPPASPPAEPIAPLTRAEGPPVAVPAPLPAAEETPSPSAPAPEPVLPPPTPRVTALPQERKPRPFFPMFRRKEPAEPSKAGPVPPPPPPAPAPEVAEGPKSTGRIEIPKPKSAFLPPRPVPFGSRAEQVDEPPAAPRPAPEPEPVPAEEPTGHLPPEPEPAPAPEPMAETLPEAVFVETEHLPRAGQEPPPEIPEQDSLQAAFMTEEYLSVERVVELCGGLPGIKSVVLSRGAGVVASHHVPETFDLVSLSAHALEMLGAMRASAAKMGVGAVPAVTIHSDKGPITFFQQEDLCLLVLHKDRGFVPGVREKLQRVIEELSRANLPLPVGRPRPQIKPF